MQIVLMMLMMIVKGRTMPRVRVQTDPAGSGQNEDAEIEGRFLKSLKKLEPAIRVERTTC